MNKKFTCFLYYNSCFDDNIPNNNTLISHSKVPECLFFDLHVNSVPFSGRLSTHFWNMGLTPAFVFPTG